MLINGEKYACDACVRGHRVSNCTHSERPLTHINKKGRPVSQCPHCRTLRKSRASHVKCECGEKAHTKEECPDLGSASHLKETPAVQASLGNATSDGKSCCCTHGARCTCALKKEYLQSVPETDLPSTALLARKPRLAATNSESSLTHFTNGHHKPIHKHNDAHNKLGAPYKIPIPHSIKGNKDIASKSSDSLPLGKSLDYTASPMQDTKRSAQQQVRQVKSEHGSPKPRSLPRFTGCDSTLPSLDLSSTAYVDSMGSPSPDDFLHWQRSFDPSLSAQDDMPVMSPGFSMPPVDWTALDLGVSSSYSQPASYANFDHNYVGQPALASSSSGDFSDTEDFKPRTAPAYTLMSFHDIPHSSPGNFYRQDTSSSYLSQPTSEILSSGSPNSLERDDPMPKTTGSPTDFEDSTSPMSSERYVMHGLTVQDAQKLAHPGPPTEASNEPNLPTQAEKQQTPWAMPFDPEERLFTPDGEERTVWAN
ncbi:MAG: hypothetical protein LQ348_007265 [Seirophora lacunosa]|nr:MAG: hypothetical protein LQ344_007301 [Seirophora lacunosa]KAI4169488.1 MAG: hypothetical protein LQ348_007265 [Seirophora lacunosa]